MTAVIAQHGLGTSRGVVWQSLRRNPSGLAGLSMLGVMVVLAVLAPVIAPHDPTLVDFDTRYQMPGTVGYVLGTDDLGRDIASRLLYGIQVSLQVGVFSSALAVAVGVPLGLIAGWSRALGSIIDRLTDVLLAFPVLIIAIALAATSGPSLANAVLALGISSVPVMIRVVRGEAMRVRSTDFVTSAISMNASTPRILAQHVLPNCASAIIVQVTVIIPVVIIGEALLSFLGIGVQPPTPSLGIMLSDAQQYITQAPMAAIFPGVAIAIICLGFNMFGDALRDALDPSSVRR